MSNTDWYAALEASAPWKAFNAYARDVKRVFDQSHESASPKPIELDMTALSSLADEASALYEALPVSEKTARRHCYGLPRKYPKFWMTIPHSNSLLIEYRLVQSIPTNGLRSQD